MRLFIVVCLLAGGSMRAAAANWPAWRGPSANGASEESKFPTTWDRTNNVLWRIDLPEPGNSSPVVWGERVFVTQAMGRKRALLCLDAKNGRKLWEAGPVYAPNKSGDVFVFAAAPAFRSLSTNSVAEPTNASLALSNARIYMRTDKSLWCFGAPAL